MSNIIAGRELRGTAHRAVLYKGRREDGPIIYCRSNSPWGTSNLISRQWLAGMIRQVFPDQRILTTNVVEEVSITIRVCEEALSSHCGLEKDHVASASD